MGGLDALSVIRGLLPHTIIAIISAYTEDLSEEDIESADVVLAKPVRVDSFLELMGLTREIRDHRDSIRDLGI